MLRIPQNLHERAIGMHNAGMTMNAVAMNIGCSTPFDTLGSVFQQQGARKIDHVVDVRASRRVAKTTILGTPTCAIASKLQQLPLVKFEHISLPFFSDHTIYIIYITYKQVQIRQKGLVTSSLNFSLNIFICNNKLQMDWDES